MLLHGFTGSVRSWDEVRPALRDSATLIVVDLIGHGESAAPPDPSRYTLDAAAADLASLLDSFGFQKGNLLGYSMGGRVALHFAVSHPERVERLVLESASPGISDDAQRLQRRVADDALAQRILDEGIAAFVAEWERQPLLALAPHVAALTRERQHIQRLANSAPGLANSLRGMGAGQQAPLWSQLPKLEMPIRLIVGESDFRYRDIATRMLESLPRAELTVVHGAGHTVHVDEPTAFARLVKQAPAPADCTLSSN